MMQQPETNIAVLFNENRLADLYDVLDELHTAASEGTLHTMNARDKRELLALLNDVVYTAQETIREINQQSRREEKREPKLRILEKPRSDQKGA
ncbi:MAG: hypothetical protein SF029_23400 [bacterium]|nr:hypothetical protein [bacterium]